MNDEGLESGLGVCCMQGLQVHRRENPHVFMISDWDGEVGVLVTHLVVEMRAQRPRSVGFRIIVLSDSMESIIGMMHNSSMDSIHF